MHPAVDKRLPGRPIAPTPPLPTQQQSLPTCDAASRFALTGRQCHTRGVDLHMHRIANTNANANAIAIAWWPTADVHGVRHFRFPAALLSAHIHTMAAREGEGGSGKSATANCAKKLLNLQPINVATIKIFCMPLPLMDTRQKGAHLDLLFCNTLNNAWIWGI